MTKKTAYRVPASGDKSVFPAMHLLPNGRKGKPNGNVVPLPITDSQLDWLANLWKTHAACEEMPAAGRGGVPYELSILMGLLAHINRVDLDGELHSTRIPKRKLWSWTAKSWHPARIAANRKRVALALANINKHYSCVSAKDGSFCWILVEELRENAYNVVFSIPLLMANKKIAPGFSFDWNKSRDFLDNYPLWRAYWLTRAMMPFRIKRLYKGHPNAWVDRVEGYTRQQMKNWLSLTDKPYQGGLKPYRELHEQGLIDLEEIPPDFGEPRLFKVFHRYYKQEKQTTQAKKTPKCPYKKKQLKEQLKRLNDYEEVAANMGTDVPTLKIWLKEAGIKKGD